MLPMVKAELQAITSALVGGAKYGVKIRLPHALVMTFLFRRDLSSKDKLRTILRLTFQHASSLAAFATLYKVILASLKLTSQRLIDVGDDSATRHASWMTLGRKILLAIGENKTQGLAPGHCAAHEISKMHVMANWLFL